MMKIQRILNNNSVTSIDENNEEVLLLGRGIGFKCRVGDMIDEQKIEKQFVLKDKNHRSRFQEILHSIPQEYIIVAEQIIDFAEKVYHMKLNEAIHVSLVDHIYNAVSNYKEGIIIPNSILTDVIRFYPDEYDVGKNGLNMIEEKLECRLADDEAGFIAMHFVTAQYGKENGNTKKMISLVREINEMILSELKIEIDESSLTYYRYMTHLKCFAQRVMQDLHYPNENGNRVLEAIMLQYPQEYQCSKKVCEYIRETYNYRAGYDEEIYLSVHLARLNVK